MMLCPRLLVNTLLVTDTVVWALIMVLLPAALPVKVDCVMVIELFELSKYEATLLLVNTQLVIVSEVERAWKKAAEVRVLLMKVHPVATTAPPRRYAPAVEKTSAITTLVRVSVPLGLNPSVPAIVMF